MADANPGTFSTLVSLITGTAWPLVLGATLYHFRVEVRDLLIVGTEKLRSAQHVKFGSVEIEGIIQAEVEHTKEVIEEVSSSRKIPRQQIESSKRLNHKLSSIGVSQEERAKSVEPSLNQLADEYDALRRNQPESSPSRTEQMNEIAAIMRTLALPAFPLLRRLSRSSSAGKRLAAIAILQVKSSKSYVDWLEERFAKEQPFIFFQASLVFFRMSQIARFRTPELRSAIERSLNTVQMFKGGQPDASSIEVLQEALRLLE